MAEGIPQASLAYASLSFKGVDGNGSVFEIDTVPPRYVQSANITTYLNNSAAKAEVVLFDPSWKVIESLLLSTQGSVVGLTFGYVDGLVSPEFLLKVVSYTPSFEIDGVILTISMIGAMGTSDANAQVKSRSWVDTEKNPLTINQILEKIASENGWKLSAADIKPILERQGYSSSDPTNRLYTQNKETDIAFLKRISVEAFTTAGSDHAINFYIDDSTDPPTLNFRPTDKQSDAVRGYIYQREADGKLISYEPDLGSVGKLIAAGAGEISTTSYDPITGGQYNVNINNNTIAKEHIVVGDNKTPSYDYEPTSNTHGRNLTISGVTQEMARARLATHWEIMRRATAKASATIIGDPTIKVRDIIEVLVLTPDFTPHFTSGVWEVHEVTHDIKPGEYITQLTLGRTTVGAGNLSANILNTIPKPKNKLGSPDAPTVPSSALSVASPTVSNLGTFNTSISNSLSSTFSSIAGSISSGISNLDFADLEQGLHNNFNSFLSFSGGIDNAINIANGMLEGGIGDINFNNVSSVVNTANGIAESSNSFKNTNPVVSSTYDIKNVSKFFTSGLKNGVNSFSDAGSSVLSTITGLSLPSINADRILDNFNTDYFNNSLVQSIGGKTPLEKIEDYAMSSGIFRDILSNPDRSIGSIMGISNSVLSFPNDVKSIFNANSSLTSLQVDDLVDNNKIFELTKTISEVMNNNEFAFDSFPTLKSKLTEAASDMLSKLKNQVPSYFSGLESSVRNSGLWVP